MTDHASAIPPRPTPKGDSPAGRTASGQGSIVTRARAAAEDVENRAVARVDANPLGVLAGGIAVGLLAGALLPRSQREAALLGSLGSRLNKGAAAAFRAAKTAGVAEMTAAGLSRVNASDQVNKLIEAAIRALASAGTAAKQAAVDPAAAAKPANKARASKGTGA